MEAAVTFVGFAASLVTLIAVVGDSAQTVHTLWSNFRDSPTNLKRLIHAIAENEALLKDMQAVSDAYERVGIPESLLSRWKSTSTSVCNDFRELNLEMSKILECTKGSEITRRHLRRRVRHFFSEKTLESRCQQLSTHKADMGYIHLLMHSSYTIQIGEKLQSFGQMIETSRQENLSKLTGLQDSLQATQTDLVQAVQSELGRYKNPWAIEQAFNIVTDQPILHKRYSRPSVENPELPLHYSKAIDNRNPCYHGSSSSGLVYAVQWHSRKYHFAIGSLQVEHVESVDVEMNEGEAAFAQLVSCRSKRMRFIFQPPPWFSSLIMKIDIAMQIARHGCTPSITWGPLPAGRRLEPLVDELHQISNLNLDRRLRAIAEIGELDYLFEDIISYCLGFVSSSDGRLSQKQRDARPIADALEQGHISFPGGEVGSRFLTKIIIRIEGIKDNKPPNSERPRGNVHQPLSKASVFESDDILLDRARGYLSETQRAIMLTSNLIGAGAQLPASIDFASILMSDHGLWYLQSICPSFDVTEIGNLSLPSQWIFACLVRTVSSCRESVSRQLQGFPVNALQFYISAERLTHEINRSHESLRHRFLLSLSVGGSMSMLEALLFHGILLGDLSTYYFEKATKRGPFDLAFLFLNYGACLSLETSTRLLEHTKTDWTTQLLDPSKSESFCCFLERALGLFGPLQELDDEQAIFESLVRIFQTALLQSKPQHIRYSRPSSDDNIPNRVVRLLLEAGLFRDSKLPARYWSYDLLFLTNENIVESPLTLAVYVRNVYAIELLLRNGYDVNELHHYRGSTEGCNCMEHKGTPLTYAIWLGFTEVVTVLLEAGADVTKMGSQCQTAPEMAEVCLSTLTAKEPMGCAKDTSLEDYEAERNSRHRIFTMVCANLKSIHGKDYEDFIDNIRVYVHRGSLLRFATHHPPMPNYWIRVESRCAYCPRKMMGSDFKFSWNGFWRLTVRCPCLACCFGGSSSESKHSPLSEPWQRLFAPCKCSFVEGPTGRREEHYLRSDGVRRVKRCPLAKFENCRLRILYINHTTGESTLHCPCATCSPDWKGVPCLSLGMLFGEDEPGAPDGQSDPLIPAQDLTRVGTPCWRLGGLFGEHGIEGLELEDDPIIPAQDVGLEIFDDMPGFALAENHIMKPNPSLVLTAQNPARTSTKQGPPLATSASTTNVSHLQQGRRSLGVLTSLTTRYIFSFLASYTAALSTRSAADSRFLSLGEGTEALGGLVLSVFLVIVHECVGVYLYVKKLPPPPRFLWRLAVLVLSVVGVRIFKGDFGVV